MAYTIIGNKFATNRRACLNYNRRKAIADYRNNTCTQTCYSESSLFGELSHNGYICDKQSEGKLTNDKQEH